MRVSPINSQLDTHLAILRVSSPHSARIFLRKSLHLSNAMEPAIHSPTRAICFHWRESPRDATCSPASFLQKTDFLSRIADLVEARVVLVERMTFARSPYCRLACRFGSILSDLPGFGGPGYDYDTLPPLKFPATPL